MPTCPVCQRKLAVLSVTPFAINRETGDAILAPRGRAFMGVPNHPASDDPAIRASMTPEALRSGLCPGAGLAVLE